MSASDKPCFVYMLFSALPRPKSYVGWTHDPTQRLALHNNGRGAKATRGRQWEIIHCEQVENRPAALKREHALKHDRQARRALIAAHLQG